MLQRATHILLDAARMGSPMSEARTRNKAHDSLYRGTSQEKLSAVAPYIFQFTAGTPFAAWYLKQGWGSSWGTLIKSSWPLPELHKHFRKFLMVQTEEGRSLYFRFYDPRVLRIFLPTCNTTQLREFFGPIDFFIMEDDDPAFAVRYWHENGFLRTDRFPVMEYIGSLQEPEPLPEVQESLPPETEALLKKSEMPGPEKEEKAIAPPELPSHIVPDPMPQEEIISSPRPKTRWNMFD
jgi:hypothetical protein